MAKQGAKAATPRLRFPEFRSAPGWSAKILGEEGEFLSTLTGKSAQDFGTGKAKYVTYMNVFSNTFTDMRSLGTVDVGGGESQNAIQPGDVLFTVSSETPEEVGMSSVVVEAAPNCYVNSFCAMFRFSEGRQPNLHFLGYSLRQPFARRHFVKRAQGSTRFNLSKPAFRSLPLALPVRSEQQKIADCLTSLDEVIAAQGRKVEALKAHKCGLMQQLFPREGETRPRLRFPEFRDAPEWGETTIGELGSFYYGKSAPKWSLAGDAPTKCVRYGELYTKFGTVISETFSRTNIDPKSLRFSKGGEILVPRVGEKPEDFGKCCSYLPLANVAIGEMISVFETNQNPLFYTYYFRNLYRQFAKVVEGQNVKNLYYAELEPLAICRPTLEEQQKIADLLISVDDRITAEVAQVAAFKIHKQGLMQQLFPAPEAVHA